MTLASDERRAIVTTFQSAGPDAPTLCEGWQTHDLALHMVLRERRPDTVPGTFIPAISALRDHNRRVTARYREKSWEDLLADLRQGPPAYSPIKWADPLINGVEFFVHHEDVRRGSEPWVQRNLGEAVQGQLWKQLGLMVPLMLRQVPGQLVLRAPGFGEKSRGSGARVVLTGNPSELLLWAFGRKAVELEFEGEDSAVAAVQATSRGM